MVKGSSDIARTSSSAANAVANLTQESTPEINQTITSTSAVQVLAEQSSAPLAPDTTNAAEVTNLASSRPRLINLPSATNSETATTRVADGPEISSALPTAQASDNATDASEPTSTESVTELDQPDAQSSSSEDSNSTTLNENGAPADLAKQWLEKIKTFTLEKFNGLSQQGKLLLAAVIAMPIVLWMLLSGRRKGSRRQVDNSHYARENLKRRAQAPREQFGANTDDGYDPISANWAAEADSLFDDTPTSEPATMVRPKRAAVEEPVQATGEEATTLRLKPTENERDNSRETQHKPRVESALKTQQSGFAGWLNSQSRKDQLSLSIEFLMYWIAFGDERYDPSLKRRIFQIPNPSNQDIVKRWVLKEDVHAFADVIDWMQRNTTSVQKHQTVRLLMALLINGDVPTPVQNTLLRFLGDVFYLEEPTVEVMFEQDFDASLPTIPRVDRVAWWERQTPATISTWDARAINSGDPLNRHAAQLGVHPDSQAEPIETAYHRAVERCDGKRFDHLGDREHQLIAGRRSRLLQAYDELMEALV